MSGKSCWQRKAFGYQM